MKNQHIGSNFDDFLVEKGLLAECEAGALKRAVAWQLAQEMKHRRDFPHHARRSHEDPAHVH